MLIVNGGIEFQPEHLFFHILHFFMPERDIQPAPERAAPLILTVQDIDLLEYILSAEELELLKRADQGELLCLHCEQPFLGVVMIAEEYEGLTLVCLECGYCEY